MKGSRSQQSSPATSSSSSVASQGTREPSDPHDHSPLGDMDPRLSGTASVGEPNDPSSLGDIDLRLSGTPSVAGTKSSEKVAGEGSGKAGNLQDLTSIVDSTEDQQTILLISQPNCWSHPGLPELNRPLILHHPHMVDGVGTAGDESSMSWLYDFYPNILESSPKDELESYVEQSSGSIAAEHHHHVEQQQSEFGKAQQQSDFGQDSHPTIFKSQEKYVVTLGAPISIAQRMNDDTLTYLNKGQFYSVYVEGNVSMSLPQHVKTVMALSFFDEADRRVELSHWQYWYNLQANPNQKAFDIDRKNCENVHGKFEDLAYNATSFMWAPEVGVKIVLRINCLSTEFSSQKGVKGLPLYLVADTYEDVETDAADPVHRAFCRIKVFRDKGAERKNKDETKSVERRMQKFMKRQSDGVPESEKSISSTLFYPPSKKTVLTSTSTFGPKPFLFVPHFQDFTRLKMFSERPSNFLANIMERETKRTFSQALKQAKEDFVALDVEGEGEDTPPKKAPRIPNQRMTTVYVRKKEENVYKALILDSLTVHDFKLQIARKYDIPPDMIKDVLKKTKKGLLVSFDDDMISRFEDEDDFIIDLTFDNPKGYFNLFIHY